MSDKYWESCGSYTDIRYEKSKEGVAKITINRPEVRNAFRPLTVREMRKALEDAREDTQIGVIILTGEGEKHFVQAEISVYAVTQVTKTMKPAICVSMF